MALPATVAATQGITYIVPARYQGVEIGDRDAQYEWREVHGSIYFQSFISGL
jgi:hypothetical protein